MTVTSRDLRHAPLRSAAGAIDLASILTGAIVLGIISAIAMAGIFGVIPWAQNLTAQQDLSMVRAAQSAAKIKEGVFLNRQELLDSEYIAHAPTGVLDIDADATGDCWVASSTSGSGKTYYATSESKTVTETKPNPASCDADAGWVWSGDGTPFRSASSKIVNGKVQTNRAISPYPGIASGWYSNNSAVYPNFRDTETVRRPGTTSTRGTNANATPALLSQYAVGAVGYTPDGSAIAKPGETVTFSLYVMADHRALARLSVGFTDEANANLGITYSPYVELDEVGTWQRLTQTIKVPDGATRIRLGDNVSLIDDVTDGTQNAWAQDAQIDSGDRAQPYIDGNMPGAWWGDGKQIALSEQ